MKSNYLLSNKYKIPGWGLLVSGLVLGVYLIVSGMESDILETKVLAILGGGNGLFSSSNTGAVGDYFRIIENSVFDEIVALMIIIGGLFVGFSKEKVEDEFIYKLRKDSLVWAIILNYIVLIFAIIFVYNFSFFNILVYNMFTPLLFFIIRFNFLKHRS
ncbi:hypothetical protein [uncultured Psychroserpens sp.]|uniref:hypothetical protein n=1 Tax=uncultured Psychroserpens sp. TaxID=255436 RepID=UPI00262F4384|nr:hypothetical protein [uncultured Psychroserpens sp.]